MTENPQNISKINWICKPENWNKYNNFRTYLRKKKSEFNYINNNENKITIIRPKKKRKKKHRAALPLFALLSFCDHFAAKNQPLSLSNVPVRQPSTVVSHARKHRQTADTTVRIDKCLLLAWDLYFLLSVSWFFWWPWGYERKMFLSASIIPVTSILEVFLLVDIIIYNMVCVSIVYIYLHRYVQIFWH